jgi:hypothetical protein
MLSLLEIVVEKVGLNELGQAHEDVLLLDVFIVYKLSERNQF